jgi:hypothetical protein
MQSQGMLDAFLHRVRATRTKHPYLFDEDFHVHHDFH